MAGVLRRLVTVIELRSREALAGLKLYDRTWKAVAKGVDAAAAQIEKSADRAAAAMSRVSAGAAGVRAGAGGGAGGRGRGGGGAAGRAAAGPSAARQAGLAAGAAPISDATKALGAFASASDKAKASVKDLEAQVARNRKEMAELRVQVAKTGDADGTLTERMRGLGDATRLAQVQLQGARRTLREVDGGLIDTIKSTANLGARFGALKVAAGNLISSGVQRIGGAVADGLQAAAGSAIKFESGMADVAKVVDGLKTPTGEITAEYTAMESKILDLSKTIAGPGAEGFAKIYAAAGEAGIAKEDLNQFAESAAKVSVAFGISADEAGSGMAKMRSGLGLTQDEVESLAGTMNYLSNNMAVNAKQAMEVVLTTGGVGKAANVSGQEVAGLGAAMIAAGAQSDVAATASKNYILALSSGSVATKAQRAAFKALGMDAEEVAKQFTGSAEQRLKVQQDLLTKIGKLSEDRRVSVLSQLFGKESLGAISGITGNVEQFTKAMQMATDTTAAASSVQNEYNVRSKTTENAVALLKANIEALAIKFGQALLPYINKVVEFLTSPEGQEWGAKAVAKAVEVVTAFAEGIKTVVSGVGTLIDVLGPAGLAGALLALAGPGGPFKLVALAGIAMGAAIGNALYNVMNQTEIMANKMAALHAKARGIELAQKEAALSDMQAEGAQVSHEERQKKQAFDAAEAWYEREKKKAGGDKLGALLKRRNAMEEALLSGRYQAGTTFEQRLAAFGAEASAGGGAAGGGGGMARFEQLVAARRRGKLKPSEAKELRDLSKSLDVAIPDKGGHKATKMDKQLAAMDPRLRGLLVQGGERDKGGDLKVHDDILSRGAFAAAGKAHGLGGISSGSGGVGPGPNITTHNYFNTVNVNQSIDARSSAAVPENIRSSANDAGQRAGQVVITGMDRARAMKQGGGRMA